MIVLCSHIETGIGLIAPSLPHLRRLWMIHISDVQDTPQPPNTDDIVTIGRFPRSRTRRFATDSFKNPTDIGISLTTIQANADGLKTWRGTQGGNHHGGGLDDGGELLERREGGGIETVHSYTVEFEHEWDGDSSILESGKSARVSSRNI